MSATILSEQALQKAAKYICTAKCGRCPAIEEDFPCPTVCGLETQAWQCWQIFFKHRANPQPEGFPPADS